MSDAELRKLAGELPKDLAEYTPEDLVTTDQIVCRWIDEHPADDDEPWAVEWMLSVGFEWVIDPCGSADRLQLGDPSETMPQTLSYYPGTGEWVYGCCGVVVPVGRGGVRRLCRALGIPLKA